MRELKEHPVEVVLGVLSAIGVIAICNVAYSVATEQVEGYVRKTASEAVYVKHLQERVAYLEASRMAERGDEFAESLLDRLREATKDNQAFIEGERAFQRDIRGLSKGD